MMILQIVADAVGGEEHSGMYIKSFDPNFPHPLGLGELTFTPITSEAKKFETAGEALEFYRQQSPTVPMRFDGKPNRPITAYSVEFVRLP